jgi:hypothetical protein
MTAAHRAQADRLITALADLLAREALAARGGSGLAVRALQDRIAPLISRLVELSEAGFDPEVAAAWAEIRRRREDNRRLMEAARERLRGQIAAKTANLGKLRRIAPAYRRRQGAAAHLDVTR